MKRYWLAIIGIICCCMTSFATALIPSPCYLEVSQGCFQIKKKNVVVYAEDTTIVSIHFLLKEIIEIGDLSIKHTKNPQKADISFIVKKKGHQEGYKLAISTKQIQIEAESKAGFMYAARTLQQWRRNDEKGHMVFDCVQIEDAPRMSWRGFMLDSGRQYQSVSTIKKYIEMASIKRYWKTIP